MGCSTSHPAEDKWAKRDPNDWTDLHKGARQQYASAADVDEDWEHGRLLGEGAFGRVEVVTKRNAPFKGTDYACKRYGLVDYVDDRGEVWPAIDEGALAREINLIQALGSSEHHIMQIYGVLETPTSVHLILERCDMDLLRYVAGLNDGAFPETAAAAYAKQLLTAVAHCHERNVMHRHINLEDLLMRRDHGALALCLGDFGHATAFRPGTVLRRPKNSAIYASPEEILVGEYDEKIDVWSCGVVTLCLVGGLGGVDKRAYRALHKRGVRGALALRTHPRSESMVALLEDLLARDPKLRVSAARALENHGAWLSEIKPGELHPLDEDSRRCYAGKARAALLRADIEREVNRNIRRAPSEERNLLADAIKDAGLRRAAGEASPGGGDCASTHPERCTDLHPPSVCFRKSVQKVILANRRKEEDVLDDVLARDDVLTVAQLREAVKEAQLAEPDEPLLAHLDAALGKVENPETILSIELSPLVKDRRAFFTPPPEQSLDQSRHVRFKYDVVVME